MAFVPRSVARGKAEVHGDSSVTIGGNLVGGNGDSHGRGNFVDGGGMGSLGCAHGRGRGRNIFYENTFKPVDQDKGPLKKLHPNDSELPNFLKDNRNTDKIEQLISEDRLGSNPIGRTRKSDDDKLVDGSDHYQLYPESIVDKREGHGNNDAFSEEGLRITVEMKDTDLSVADPSFYDEIQACGLKQTSSLSKTRNAVTVTKKMEYENISDSDESITSPRQMHIKVLPYSVV
jgi:hypothetical protein